MGYVWKTKDYPWLNLWQQWVDGKLWAKGLEFGTSGIGRSYQELLAVDTRFHGRSSYLFLDATETLDKSYLCFELAIPADFQGVSALKLEKSSVEIREKMGTAQGRSFRVTTNLTLN